MCDGCIQPCIRLCSFLKYLKTLDLKVIVISMPVIGSRSAIKDYKQLPPFIILVRRAPPAAADDACCAGAFSDDEPAGGGPGGGGPHLLLTPASPAAAGTKARDCTNEKQ